MDAQDDFFQQFSRKVICPGEKELLKTRWVHTNPLTDRVDVLEERVTDLEQQLAHDHCDERRKRPKCNKATY